MKDLTPEERIIILIVRQLRNESPDSPLTECEETADHLLQQYAAQEAGKGWDACQKWNNYETSYGFEPEAPDKQTYLEKYKNKE